MLPQPKLGFGLALFFVFIIDAIVLNPWVWMIGFLAYIGFWK